MAAASAAKRGNYKTISADLSLCFLSSLTFGEVDGRVVAAVPRCHEVYLHALLLLSLCVGLDNRTHSPTSLPLWVGQVCSGRVRYFFLSVSHRSTDETSSTRTIFFSVHHIFCSMHSFRSTGASMAKRVKRI